MNARPSFNVAFTPAEDDLIRARYPAEGSVKLAEEMGRTRNSVACRAQRLGVRVITKRTVTPKPQTINYIALGIRTGKRLEPISREEEQAAIQRFLAEREVTVCPPGHAHGLTPQFVGKERYV